MTKLGLLTTGFTFHTLHKNHIKKKSKNRIISNDISNNISNNISNDISNNISNNDISSNDISSNDISSNDISSNDISSNDNIDLLFYSTKRDFPNADLKHVCGVYIEPRDLPQIYKNIENFFDVLPDCKLYFFCGNGLKKKFLDTVKYKNITIIELEIVNFNFQTYSNFMKSPEFWDTFDLSYTHILTIQSDGCLCKNSTHNLIDFMHYDYVGGYSHNERWWVEVLHYTNDKYHYKCFNGGFSLRNIRACRDVIINYPSSLTEVYYRKCPHTSYAEDVYFVIGMLKLKYNVGRDKFATNFCSHTTFTNNSFCIHKLNKYIDGTELEKCLEYCPDFEFFL